jgi:hypothetical protein
MLQGVFGNYFSGFGQYKTMLLAGNLLRAFSNGVDLRRKAYPLRM